MSEQNSVEKKLLENLQQYCHQLATEAKKKHPPLKEAAESGIVRIRSVARQQNVRNALIAESAEIMEPFFIGCDTKSPKVVQICLNAIQKLITYESVSHLAANNLINCMWNLMESGVEEVKLLQTITLLISTNSLVQGESLAKALSLCFRLHFTKNSTTNNTASATIRQLVSAIFERVQLEDKTVDESIKVVDLKFDEVKLGKYTPISLKPAALDAFFFFQDLVQLVNADQPFWLTGLTEMTRTFGLELLELIFTSFPDVFYKHEEFSFLLKERVCQLVIKLFSPNTKQRTQMPLAMQQQTNPLSLQPNDKPFWPITVRLLRIIAILIQKFYTMLITESEIFLSLLVKSLEGDKPNWQRSMTLEALYKMIQPNLISCLCRFYDMKPHSSKIFRDIVNGLCIYIQSQFLFIDSSSTQSLIASIVNNQTSSLATTASNSSINSSISSSSATMMTPQPAFMLRGIWIPLLYNVPKVSYKPYYIEQLDKLEAPSAPEGHGLSSAFACLIEIVQNITVVIEGDIDVSDVSKHMETIAKLDEDTFLLHKNLLNASWCGILGAFSLLLDASTDETITDLILNKMQKLASLYGIYKLDDARDATLTSICKSSLPPNYTLSVLNIVTPSESVIKFPKQLSRQQSFDSPSNSININSLISQQNSLVSSNGSFISNSDNSETRQQVVAVGTPLPSPSLPQNVQQGPVMLTSKNLQCMNQILSFADSHGSVLNEKSWHITLTTLQHLVWILGLKPATNGSLKVGRAGTEAGASTNALITTAAMSDLPVLSTMLSRLFESSHYASVVDLLSQVFQSSQYLPTQSLLDLVNALIKLSNESLDIAYNNREPSLFAVAKLLETGIVNINRIDLIWKQITSHLLEVCHHPHSKMREWGVEALCSLVKSTLTHSQSEQKQQKESDSSRELSLTALNQCMFLSPLQELSYISHSDIRQKQLDCALQILQSSGDSLTYGWPQIFEIVGAINDNQTENSIRCAFQCLQLIIADFLALVPSNCLIKCVNTTAKFGTQSQELNVSLTAIGLLWNIADFFYSNQSKIKSLLEEESNQNCDDLREEVSAPKDLPSFDALWMCLFTRLGDLCTDSRSPVRKSAGQTLFSTLTTHGSILGAKTWQSVLWNVLFPLLERVKVLSISASKDKINESKGGASSANIIIHHSRNTAQKQWSETQVLVLSGVSRIFSLKLELLVTIDEFHKIWTLLLEFIENSALSKNTEVSLSALKCFQEIVSVTKSFKNNETANGSEMLWNAAWNVWYNIGTKTTQLSELSYDSSCDIQNKTYDNNHSIYIPSQGFLASLIQIFPYLFIHLKSKFCDKDFEMLSQVLQNAVSVPIMNSDVSLAYIMPSFQSLNDQMTPLQESTLYVLETLQKEILVESDLFSLLPFIFNQYLVFSCYAVNIIPSSVPFSDMQNANYLFNESSNTYCYFGERAMRNAVNLYQQTANTTIAIKSHALHSIIKSLKIPLCMKYSCPSQTTWKLAVTSLINVLQVGLPIARQHMSDFIGIWGDLALSLDGFLFPTSKPLSTQTLEEQQFDESLDVKVVELIRDRIMPYAAHIPKEFLLQIVSLLNRGSIHSATNTSPVDTESTRKLREEFARTCFETLLQFSFLGPKGNPGLFIQSMGTDLTPDHSIGIVNKLAVTSILQRFNEVVIKYVDDEKLCPCPLPRHRMAEISFVLKALATLIASLKKAPIDSVESSVWDLLIRLYPHLVNCSTSNSVHVNGSLREVLHEYSDLLAPPNSKSFKSLPNGC